MHGREQERERGLRCVIGCCCCCQCTDTVLTSCRKGSACSDACFPAQAGPRRACD